VAFQQADLSRHLREQREPLSGSARPRARHDVGRVNAIGALSTQASG